MAVFPLVAQPRRSTLSPTASAGKASDDDFRSTPARLEAVSEDLVDTLTRELKRDLG